MEFCVASAPFLCESCFCYDFWSRSLESAVCPRTSRQVRGLAECHSDGSGLSQRLGRGDSTDCPQLEPGCRIGGLVRRGQGRSELSLCHFLYNKHCEQLNPHPLKSVYTHAALQPTPTSGTSRAACPLLGAFSGLGRREGLPAFPHPRRRSRGAVDGRASNLGVCRMRESGCGLCRGRCSLQTAGSQAGHPLRPRGAELPGECPHSPGAAGLLGGPGALGAAASHHVLARMHTGARVHTQHPHTCTHAYIACTHMCTHSYTACTHAHTDTHSTHTYTHTQPAHTHTYARTAHTYRCTCIYDIHIYNSHTCAHT